MPDANISYVASGTIGVSRIVQKVIGSVGRCAEAGALDATTGAEYAGIAQEGSYQAPGLEGVSVFPAATDGKPLKVYGPGDECVVVAGATISAHNRLKSDANSFGVPISRTATANPEAYIAVARESCVSGGLVRVRVEPGFYIDN